MSRWMLTLACAGMTLSAAASRAGDETPVKPSDLVGVWTITRGEREGTPEPEERVKGTMVRFSEDRVVVVDKENKEIYGAEYKIGAPVKAQGDDRPVRITMTSKLSPAEGTVARGLIEKHGEKVRLIYALPGGDEPTSFKTKEKQLMFEMNYQKK